MRAKEGKFFFVVLSLADGLGGYFGFDGTDVDDGRYSVLVQGETAEVHSCPLGSSSLGLVWTWGCRRRQEAGAA